MPARVGAMADIPNIQPLHYVLKDVGGLYHSPRPFRVRHNFCSATHFTFLRENRAHDAAGFHFTFRNLTRRAVGT